MVYAWFVHAPVSLTFKPFPFTVAVFVVRPLCSDRLVVFALGVQIVVALPASHEQNLALLVSPAWYGFPGLFFHESEVLR